jgi:hypothetical protein
MLCQFKKTNGKQCGANAMSAAAHCYIHNPEINPQEKREAQVRGGLARRTTAEKPSAPVEIRKLKDIPSFLKDTINQVRGGEMDVKIANCLGFLAGHLIRALEISELEERFEKLEAIVLETHKPTIRPS